VAILEKQPFGELERLVTQKLLDVVKRVAKEELNSENGLHLIARLTGRSYEQVRVTFLNFSTRMSSTCRRKTAFPSWTH